MTDEQFSALKKFRQDYAEKCREWSLLSPVLAPLQKNAALSDTPSYPLETGVVYNRALDEITADDEIKIIVIGDNPGKDEQLEKNRRYLVGQAGKIAQGFFKRNPSLGIDFRKNAIILNKTPVHTAKTKHLNFLAKGSTAAADLILQSQIWLAQKTAELAKLLGCQIWLVGYSELKEKGIFCAYRDALKAAAKQEGVWDSVFVFQHFSMNRFLIDLRDFCGIEKGADFKESSLRQKVEGLGKKHRDEIF